MQLAAWIRARLWRSDGWCAELAQLRKALASEPRSTRSIEHTWELACATEYIDPDRGRALAIYLDAWRAGHPEAGARAAVLAHELRAHVTLAELATVEGDLLAAGRAFIDAGLVEPAVGPLGKLNEPTLAVDVKPLLAIARRERLDLDREIATCMARAQAATTGGVAIYLQAARIARTAGLDPSLATVLATATKRFPTDRDVEAAVEERLLARGHADELLDHYRRRFEAAEGEAAWVASMQAAACTLIARNVHVGLGLRLLRRSLEHSYKALLPGMPHHLAAWELLTAHARASSSIPELLPLVVDAINAPLSEVDAVYLSRLGLEIVWRELGDPLAAQPYAAALIEFAPEHPLAVRYVTEVGPRLPTPLATSTPEPPPPPSPRPTAPTAPTAPLMTSTTRIAVVPPPAVAAPPPSRASLLSASAPLRALRRETARNLVPPANAGVMRAPRAVVPVDVMIELPGGAFFSTVLRDLSTSGAFVVTKRALEVGTELALELRLPSVTALTQSAHRTNATIARRTELGWGLAFVDPPPGLVAAIAAISRTSTRGRSRPE